MKKQLFTLLSCGVLFTACTVQKQIDEPQNVAQENVQEDVKDETPKAKRYVSPEGSEIMDGAFYFLENGEPKKAENLLINYLLKTGDLYVISFMPLFYLEDVKDMHKAYAFAIVASKMGDEESKELEQSLGEHLKENAPETAKSAEESAARIYDLIQDNLEASLMDEADKFLRAEGESKDMDKAIKLFKKAALDYGNVTAMRNLSLIYTNEQEYRNPAQTFYWSILAVTLGDNELLPHMNEMSAYLKEHDPELEQETVNNAKEMLTLLVNNGRAKLPKDE